MAVKDKKWKLAKWGIGLGTIISMAALIGWFTGYQGAAGIMGQGLGIITMVFGGYSAANVSQKSVIGKNYHSELDDKRTGNE